MAKAKVYRYQDLFQRQRVDENKNPVYEPREYRGEKKAGTSYNAAIWDDAPSIDLIPDAAHREATRVVWDFLDNNGSVRFSEVELKIGIMFSAVRLDYVKRWLEAHGEPHRRFPELIPVNERYFRNAKGTVPRAGAEIADSYIATGGSRAAGWVDASHQENRVVAAQRLLWQKTVERGVAKGSDQIADVANIQIDGLMDSALNPNPEGRVLLERLQAATSGKPHPR